ncbi:MAG: DUF4232 domain-containing protein [Acidimicrobiales bacterium]
MRTTRSWATGAVATATALATMLAVGVGSAAVAGASTGNGAGGSSGSGGAGVLAFGNAQAHGAATAAQLQTPVVGMAATPGGGGYWEVSQSGTVHAFGDAHLYPPAVAGAQPVRPVVAMAATPDGHGYWVVSQFGAVTAYGDAGSYETKANTPPPDISGIAATPDGHGYWLVAQDGGIFTFGNAHFYGSMGGKPLNSAVVGMAATPGGHGYWLVAQDGGIFTFGNAHFYGSRGGQPPAQPVVGMAATPKGGGYWMVEATSAQPCKGSQLTGRYVPDESSGGAAGSVGFTYTVGNMSFTSCTLHGYAELQLRDAGGHALPTAVAPRSAQPVRPPILLRYGSDAWFAIEYATQTGYGNLSCPRSASLAISPPAGYGSVLISGRGGQLRPYGGTTQHLRCGQISETQLYPFPPFSASATPAA